MPLHLGRNVSVCRQNVVLMCDMQRPLPPDTAAAVETLRRLGHVVTLGDAPKTLVLCSAPGDAPRCYLSCVGLRTLRLRAEEAFPLAARSQEERGVV